MRVFMFQQRLEKHYRLRDSKLAERGSASGLLEKTRSLKNLKPRSFNSLALTKKTRTISQQRFARNHYPETRLETIEIA